MLIDWAESADCDLSDILAYFISLDDEPTGKDIVSRLIKAAGRLSRFPLSGKPGRIRGTREIIIPTLPYALIYHIRSPELVEVVRVLHTSRLWPESLAHTE